MTEKPRPNQEGKPSIDRVERKIPVLMTHNFPGLMLDRMRTLSPHLDFRVEQVLEVDDLSEENWEEIEILYASGVLPEPEQAPNLSWIQLHSVGVEKYAGHPILKSEVKITTTSGANAPQMAEHAMMCMLGMGHRIQAMLAAQEAGELWNPNVRKRFRPQELRGSTVGILGYGSVGREVGRLSHAAGAEVLAIKRDLRNIKDEGFSLPGVGDPEAEIPRRIYPPTALASMAAECDFLVVAVPLTAETRGMVSKEVFESMKSTAYLVDLSSGSVLDHGALVEALNEKRFSGVALDVFPIEPLPESSPLWGMANVILTPHIAGESPRAQERAAEVFIENLRRYLTRDRLLNRYDAGRGY
jgi:phosphoglycerate dehydrogenase-like enzyme